LSSRPPRDQRVDDEELEQAIAAIKAMLAAYEWAVQRGRYMSLETISPLSDDPIVKLPAVAT
jgi:hypothetical protein